VVRKNFRATPIKIFLYGCLLSYLGLEYASLYGTERVFGITSLLSLPLSGWMGKVGIDSLRSKTVEGTLVYRNRWEEFCGPRYIHFIIFLLALLAFLSLILNFQIRFGLVASKHDLVLNRDHPISLIVTSSHAIASTLLIVIAACELIWSFRYEKQMGQKLFTTVQADTAESKLSGIRVSLGAILWLFIVLYIFYKIFTM
jgi:hypothetical protein